MNQSRHTYEWVMSHIRMSHVTHTNESCFDIWMMHMNESCHTHKWVMSHIRMSHVARMNESCRTYEWVMSHIRMSNILTYEWCIWMSHVTHINDTEEESPNSRILCNKLLQGETYTKQRCVCFDLFFVLYRPPPGVFCCRLFLVAKFCLLLHSIQRCVCV